ncbi:MAG: hypothetical protein LBL66_00165 [Clostridiales bacterium]|jgi:5-methyltetrahydrofolate--homocysteine methyltransferase|nr:hypothetical protein [Clostridiales bacterium]
MIRFSDKQWDKVIDAYRKFWRSELGRPILPCVLYGADPGRACPKNPPLSFENVHDFSVTPEQVIDRADYELSCLDFHGDAFPLMQTMQFGPGVMAAFLGAELHNSRETVWFHPKKPVSIRDLHFEYDGGNPWLNRVKDIYAAGMKRWRGEVVLCMTDIGGMLDVTATFLTAEGLLYDLLDEPDEVKRVVSELQGLWFVFFNEINDILKGARGYSDWSTVFSEKPSYMLQSDFSFMLGPDLFKEHVSGELRSSAARLENPFYHLDGIGELTHLDELLRIEEIKGIQWVPGEGEPRGRDWSGVYRKIGAAGKKLQVYYGFEEAFDDVLRVLPRSDQLIKTQMPYPISQKDRILARLKQFGAE